MTQFSVAMPVYNGEPFLAAAIKSALRQTRAFDEIIVFDDASTDNTGSIAAELAQGERSIVLYRSTSRFPAPKAWNEAVRCTTGEYFVILAHDDLLDNNFRMEAQKILESHDDLDLIIFPYRAINNEGIEIAAKESNIRGFRAPGMIQNHRYISEFCKNGQFFLPGGAVIRRALFDRLGGFNEGFKVAYDWEFLLRVGHRSRIYMSDKKLWSYRRHPTQSIAGHVRRDNGDSDRAFQSLSEWAPFLSETDRAALVWGMVDFNEQFVTKGIRSRDVPASEVVATRALVAEKMRRWQELGVPESKFIASRRRSWSRSVVWHLARHEAGVRLIRGVLSGVRRVKLI